MIKTAPGPSRPRRPLAAAACMLMSLLCSLCALAQGAQPGAVADLDLRLAQAKTDSKLNEALLKTGSKVAAFCANCHGDNGNSVKPDVPNLAGQNTAYLLEQLRQFGDGRRRSEFMQSMIKAMSSDEKVGAALFYALQPVTPRPAARPELLALGGDIYQKNCFRCHGAQGMGDHKIARIAGQQPEYLVLSIRRYRSGSGVRTDPLMASNTRLLSDAQVDAVAAYVSALR